MLKKRYPQNYLIKAIPWFSSKKEWTVLKETGAVIITLFGLGMAIYLMGFIMEDLGNA